MGTKTSRKRKSSDVGENEDDETTKEEESPVKKAKFDWDEVITACLKEKEGNEMKLVKLKKKCLREYFSAHENIPRKKPKFVNFVKNIMRNRARPHSIDKTWELFEQALKPAAPPAEAMEVEKAESDKT